MIVIDAKAFAAAVEALVIAARNVKDQDGLRIRANLPSRTVKPIDGTPLIDPTDWERVRAIALGAIVSLVGTAAYPGDEVHLPGFGDAA
jgi:hypothetical protein